MKKIFTTCCALLLAAPTFAQRDEFGSWLEVEAEKKITYRHGGIIFYIKNVVIVEDPETLSHDIRLQFLIDPPKTVTLMKK